MAHELTPFIVDIDEPIIVGQGVLAHATIHNTRILMPQVLQKSYPSLRLSQLNSQRGWASQPSQDLSPQKSPAVLLALTHICGAVSIFKVTPWMCRYGAPSTYSRYFSASATLCSVKVFSSFLTMPSHTSFTVLARIVEMMYLINSKIELNRVS